MFRSNWFLGLNHQEHLIEEKQTVSHPTWVRGLKLHYEGLWGTSAVSHPTWVRGLKSFEIVSEATGIPVAPHMGAWIEI